MIILINVSAGAGVPEFIRRHHISVISVRSAVHTLIPPRGLFPTMDVLVFRHMRWDPTCFAFTRSIPEPVHSALFLVRIIIIIIPCQTSFKALLTAEQS